MTALEFETANQAHWKELEAAVKLGERQLEPERFLMLYRTCCEHLALAQARGFPVPLVERLSIVTARAHQIVYRQSDYGWGRISRTLLHGFPAMVRAHRGYVAVAALLVLVPALALGFAVYHRPDLVLSVVDSRTASQFEQMYNPANPEIGRLRDAGGNWEAFGFYIMNNIGIAFQCYVMGILFGLGSAYVLLFNGALGGAVAGYVSSCGYAGTFFPFIATHSAFEVTAIVLCGAAGLRLGRSVLLPGRRTRVAALQLAARETSFIVFGAAVMLVIAAAVEAFWSSAAWITPGAKFSCAAACWMVVALFFLRRPHAD
ncbi:MAG TPA: stage II sporulation protein M [Steroidobacteraceae bacterium]|nr:stage II sporulation protein M [Steroidobacteraceae bacterium]